MTKIVLVFGLISGFILAGLVTVIMVLCLNGKVDLDHGEVLGYTTMVLGFIMVFFGIRSYRENVNRGTITFLKALQVGLLISLITCAFYVASWEIVYHAFIPDFADRYAARVIEEARAHGATAQAIAAKQQEMAEFKQYYANPLINVGMTFMEIFPVGLLMTVVSAAILRKKPRAGQLTEALS
jgi:hypothetical protein